MPFIRYATGDQAVVMGPDTSFPNARGLPRIGFVSGRLGGTVSGLDGARVPLGFFSALFAQYGYAVRHFRVVSRSPESLDLHLERARRYSGATLDELCVKIRERLGAVNIEVYFDDAVRPIVPVIAPPVQLSN